MDGRTGLRILAAVVLLAAIAGIGIFAYNAGLATHVQVPANPAGPGPYPYYGYGFWHPFGFGFFGCFGPLLAIFLVLLALRALTFVFWGPRLHMHRRWWRHGWDEEGGVPPAFREWHDRAHGQPSQPQDSDKS